MPRVAFLISGQARTNGLGMNPTKHAAILDSWTQNIFTEEFKAAYDYDVFLTANNLDVSATLAYFGPDRVKNIHLMDTGYYLKPVTPIPPVSEYILPYKVPPGFQRHSVRFHQLYKMYDVYTLMKEEGQYDYVVRLRFDTTFITDMVACIQKLHTVDMINNSEICFLGKYDIMCWAQQLLFHFGTYNPYLSGNMFLGWGRLPTDSVRWAYSHEGQASEHLFKFYEGKGQPNILVLELCKIIRANGEIETWA